MKKILVTAILILNGAALWAMPSEITFQGSLKQQGVPVTGTRNMQFSFVDASHNQIPGTSLVPINNVQVTNGLFAVQLQLDPSVPWEQYTPFIHVLVENEALTPDQPITANLYAAAAIPQGMIAMFAAACPSGWTRFSALDNRFPLGSDTYGVIGGTSTHTHSISMDGAHNHGGYTGEMNETATRVVPGSTPFDAGELLQGIGTYNFEIRLTKHDHAIAVDGAHNHGGSTGPASSLPPFLSIVYCQKQ